MEDLLTVEADDEGRVSLQLIAPQTKEQHVSITDIAIGSDVDDSVDDYARIIDIAGLEPNESLTVAAGDRDTIDENHLE